MSETPELLPWIPVSERLPDHARCVLVWRNGYPDFAEYISKNWWLSHARRVTSIVGVTHWLEITAPGDRTPSALDKLAREVADRSDEYWEAYDKWIDAHSAGDEEYYATGNAKDHEFSVLMKSLGEYHEARKGKA